MGENALILAGFSANLAVNLGSTGVELVNIAFAAEPFQVVKTRVGHNTLKQFRCHHGTLHGRITAEAVTHDANFVFFGKTLCYCPAGTVNYVLLNPVAPVQGRRPMQTCVHNRLSHDN